MASESRLAQRVPARPRVEILPAAAAPRFSVIIPAFNSREFIGHAIESALNQTYKAHEIIVIDDGSTDGTADWVAAEYGDRVRCFRKENGGPAKARNLAARVATGDWLALLDSD